MSTTATPNGFVPVNLIGGQPYAGSTRQIKIASGYATDIFYGDLVAVSATGTITKVTATGADGTTNAFPAGVVGVFLGCSYTEPTFKYFIQKKRWVAGTVAPDAFAYVADDPDLVFQVQASGSLSQSALGLNVSVVQNAGNTNTGVSALTVNAAGTGVENFRPFRIIDFVKGPNSTVGDAFTDVLVKFNAGIHSYTSGTGV